MMRNPCSSFHSWRHSMWALARFWTWCWARGSGAAAFMRLAAKRQAVVLTTFLLFLFLLGIFCAPSVEAKPVRVGFDPAYGTIALASSGTVVGYGVDYLDHISRIAGWEVQYVSCSWAKCLEMLEQGKVDMVPTMQNTPERAEQFFFADIEQGFEYAKLYSLASNDRLYYDDSVSFHNAKVGLLRGNAINEMFEKYRKDRGLAVELLYFENTYSLAEALYGGSIDMVVGGSMLALKDVKVVAEFGSIPFYVGMTKKRPKLFDEMKRALKTVVEQDKYFHLRLDQKYQMGKRGNVLSLTRSESLFVHFSPPIKVAINPHWWPVESFSDTDAQPQGILCDLVRHMAGSVGLQLEFVRTRTYEESLELMRNGQVDIITGPLSQLRTSLSGQVNFSTELLHLPLILVGKSSFNESLTGVPVGVLGGMFPENRVHDSMGLRNVIYYDSFAKMQEAVRHGDVMLMLMTSWRYGLLVREHGFHDLRVMNLVPGVEEVGLGVSSQGSLLLHSIINKAVRRIDQDQINAVIFAHTIGREPVPQWEIFWRIYGNWVITASLVLALVAVLGALYVQMRNAELMERVARTDDVTDMGNFKDFCLRGKSMLGKENHAYVSLDINNFKNFNGYYGHQAGNEVLRQLGMILVNFCDEDELAGRSNGDEFVLLLRWPGSMDAVRKRLDILLERLSSMDNPLSMQKLNLAFSVGVYHLRPQEPSLQAAGDRATVARKSAKESYKTTVGVYDEEMHRRITEEQQFEREMLGAEVRGEFFVRLQPKCNLRSGKVVGAEALIRWQHPQKGEIPPDSFVGLFERNGFIARLDMYVLDFVCRNMRRWLDLGHVPLPISVNMSRLHVMERDFVESVKAVVHTYRIEPKLIELELTETAFLENTDLLLRIMEELSAFGVRISMDDFGAGYSSLNMLKSIPVDVLKIDRAFLSSLESDRSRNIIRHVVRMAKDMDMEVVCEGIETAEQRDILRDMECDVGQGFYFSRPISLAAFEDMVFVSQRNKKPSGIKHGKSVNSGKSKPRHLHLQ